MGLARFESELIALREKFEQDAINKVEIMQRLNKNAAKTISELLAKMQMDGISLPALQTDRGQLDDSVLWALLK